MRSRRAWTLAEMLIVIAALVLVSGALLPSFSAARQRARLAACQAAMHQVHAAVGIYASAARMHMPPFAFSEVSSPSLPVSGHWGGWEYPDDPSLFGGLTAGKRWVNLYSLVEADMVPADAMICPGALAKLGDGGASYFPHTRKFSTYCLRFPPSADLFAGSPLLANRGRGGPLLGVYREAAGGQQLLEAYQGPHGEVGRRQTVPLVRLDRRYRIDPEAACGDGVYDVAVDAMFADTFWCDGLDAADSGRFQVRAERCHGRSFNVAYGAGAVRTIYDDGTIEENSLLAGGSTIGDGNFQAAPAERIWQFLDSDR